MVLCNPILGTTWIGLVPGWARLEAPPTSRVPVRWHVDPIDPDPG